MMLAIRLTAAALALFGLGFVFLNQDAVARFDIQLLVAVLAAQPFLALSQIFIAWRLKLAVHRPQISLGRCLSASLLGQASDLVLPWRLSEVVRVLYLRDRSHLPLTAGLAAIVVERAADLVVVAGLALIATSLIVVDAGIGAFVLVAAGIVALLLVLPLAEPAILWCIKFLPSTLLRRIARDLLTEVLSRLRDRTLWRVLGPSIPAWASAIGGTYAYFTVADSQLGAMPLQASLELVLTLFVVSTVGNVVAVLPAGIGTFEAGVILVLKAYGVDFEEALALGIGLHLAQLLLGAVGGITVAAFSPINFTEFVRRARLETTT